MSSSDCSLDGSQRGFQPWVTGAAEVLKILSVAQEGCIPNGQLYEDLPPLVSHLLDPVGRSLEEGLGSPLLPRLEVE